ncbi:hypothetical protein CGA63_24425, partial [Salmonella enterica subsp. enterica serovar Mbandaka]|nr:hypothetical protein [Salmonella enterica subsp. enterica serovar Mbandaka]
SISPSPSPTLRIVIGCHRDSHGPHLAYSLNVIDLPEDTGGTQGGKERMKAWPVLLPKSILPRSISVLMSSHVFHPVLQPVRKNEWLHRLYGIVREQLSMLAVATA